MADAQPNLIIQIWNALPGSYQWLQEHLGPWGALLAIPVIGLILVWWTWEHLKKKPGIERLVARIGARLRRRAITPVRDGRFTIAIAHLQGDTNGHHESLLRDELAHGFDGAECKPIDHTIAVPDAETDQASIEKATEAARKLLQKAGADVLLWGRVLPLGNRTALRLFWTPARAIDGAKPSERYQLPADSIALPPLFWDDLRQVLGLLVQTRLAAMADELQGRAAAARLQPLIGQVRKLLQARQGSWPAETEAGVRFAFAGALFTFGEQAGDNAALAESAAAYRQVLAAWTRDRVPLDWAMTQNNLGTALWTLGARESGTARLAEAVGACRLALQELTRDRVPLNWAATQNNLGTALCRLGERESGTARLAEAVDAFRLALQEWTRDRVPLAWATTQNNLGNALRVLGERESGTARLEAAVDACRLALQECTRDRVPLNWAMTQNNLGAALVRIGERESGTARLAEAVDAYRLALQEYTRDRVPLDWAGTQLNLGLALEVLANRRHDPAGMEAALAAMRNAADFFREDGVSYWLPIAEKNIRRMEAALAALQAGPAASH